MKFTKKVTALALALAVTTLSAHAATGIVTADVLNIRSGASTDSAVVGKAYTGSALNVKEYANGWYRLDYNGTQAYASADYVSISFLGEGLVNYAGDVYLRATPYWEAGLLEKLYNGERLKVTAVEGEFYEILYNGNIRYIPAVCTDVRREALVDRSLGLSSLGQRSVETAAQYLGVPYVYGGRSPSGFDCSGLTSYVYQQLGVSIPRTARAQAAAGVSVAKTDLMPGDLVFFNTTGGGISHVGIYAGNGSFIHAPLPGGSVCYANLHSSYWARTYVCATRVAR